MDSLTKERSEVQAKLDALLAKDALSAEDRTECDTLEADFERLSGEIKAAEQTAHDKKIRDEAVRETEQKYVQQRANPLLRNPAPSSQPFIPTRTGEGGKLVQPWEESKGQMKERRIGSALKSQFESEAVN